MNTIEDQAQNAIEALLAGYGLQGAKALPLLLRVAERAHDVRSTSDAFNRVRLRSIGVEEEILNAEGGLLSESELAKALALKSQQTVRRYRETGKIFAVQEGKRNFLYPAWQVHKAAILTGLAETLAVLAAKDVSPMGVVLFFLTPAEALGGNRPLDLLRRRECEEVIQHVERYGSIGS